MVFSLNECVYTHYFRVHSHVNYIKKESEEKKSPTIAKKNATHANCLEKLTNRHWNLENKAKESDNDKNNKKKLQDYAVKKEVFVFLLYIFLKHHFHLCISV